MKSVIFAGVLLFILCVPAISDEGDEYSLETLLEEIESCTGIVDDEMRLRAYDALAKNLGFYLTQQ